MTPRQPSLFTAPVVEPVAVDLFAGTGSSTEALVDAGWHVVTVERDERHEATLHADVLDLHVDQILELTDGIRPAFVWGSPPCPTYSVGAFRFHYDATTLCRRCDGDMLRVSGERWQHDGCDEPDPGPLTYTPTSAAALEGQRLVAHTLRLVAGLAPRWWVMENPVGMLRKLELTAGLPLHTVNYCSYGDERSKPTDLWGVKPRAWTPRRRCRAKGADVREIEGVEWRLDRVTGEPCHVAARRGAKTGTQGRKTVDRSRVPYDLGADLLAAVNADLDEQAAA